MLSYLLQNRTMRGLLPLIFVLSSWAMQAQYIPQGWNYGVGLSTTLKDGYSLGLGPQVEYASTCYTSYIASYNYLFPVSEEGLPEYHEFSFGIHTILFNFNPAYITVGAGYMFNTASDFDEKDKEAILFFKTGSLNHGLLLKLRTLVQVSLPFHIFIEFNAKSLGRQYDTVGFGLLYDFDLD